MKQQDFRCRDFDCGCINPEDCGYVYIYTEINKPKKKCDHNNAEFIGAVGDEYCYDCDQFLGTCDI